MKPKKKKLTLDQTHPHLLKEWDYERNWKEFGLKPEDITYGSTKKIYWICQKFPEDKWDMTPNTRTEQKQNCPFCSGRRVNSRNCLAATHPELLKEWGCTRNWNELGLRPEDLTYGSNQKVYWICKKYPEDKWCAKIASRIFNNRNCPFCAGQQVNMRNCLATTHPDLCKEWHPTKNGNLTPYDVVAGSHLKIWWQCLKYPEDEWEAVISNRTFNNTNCLFCSGKEVNNRNRLSIIHSEITKEWHPTLNGNLTSKDVSYGSNIEVWWQCPDFEEDIYQMSVNNRHNNKKCPYCAGQKINNRNCLQTMRPEIAKEWHPALNGDLKPTDFTYGSNKKVWWLCKNDHKYYSAISSRTSINDTGCPYCPNKNQNIVYFYLLNNKFNFEDEYSIRLFKDRSWPSQVDFYLPEYNLFIEYDGEQHFRPVCFGGISKEKAVKGFEHRQVRDATLAKYCDTKNIILLRIDGRKYKGRKLKQYLETIFWTYLNKLLFIKT